MMGVYNITLMDTDKILGQSMLKGLKGLECAGNTTVFHKKLGGIVICPEIEDIVRI